MKKVDKKMDKVDRDDKADRDFTWIFWEWRVHVPSIWWGACRGCRRVEQKLKGG